MGRALEAARLAALRVQGESVKSLNRATILGRIGKDADTKFTASGVAVTTFSVATDHSWKDKASGEWKSEADWHNIVLWRAENLAQYLSKGTQVYVEGRIRFRQYEDRDGAKRYVTEIVAENVVLCGGKRQPEGDGNAPSTPVAATILSFS